VVAFLKVGPVESSSEQVLLGAHVPADVADRFRALARERDGSTAAALRRLIVEAVGDEPIGPAGTGAGAQIGIRLRREERRAVSEAAKERGTTPANWLRSLALAHLTRRPQWGPAETELLRDLFRELRRIGTNINQLALRANEGAQIGRYSIAATVHANEATRRVSEELLKLGRLIAAEQAYWQVQGPAPSKTQEADEA